MKDEIGKIEMERWTSGTGQELMVHNSENCKGEFCPIHNPSNHHMKDWPTHFRDDRGIMERICKCGVGHPDPDDLAFRLKKGSNDTGIHGCCGCCTSPSDINYVHRDDGSFRQEKPKLKATWTEEVKRCIEGGWKTVFKGDKND